MKHFLRLLFILIVFGCSSKTDKKVIITESKVYKQSEMAALMLKMYDLNLENKKLILEGKFPKDFPKVFLQIHSAKLTDSTDRNPVFDAFSEVYIQTLETLYNSTQDSLSIKHNNTINSCISCHKTTCIGPIPKIKKLLIPKL